MTDADFLFPLVKSHLHHKICPLQHLQLNLCIDLYVLVEHHVVRPPVEYPKSLSQTSSCMRV